MSAITTARASVKDFAAAWPKTGQWPVCRMHGMPALVGRADSKVQGATQRPMDPDLTSHSLPDRAHVEHVEPFRNGTGVVEPAPSAL